MATAARGGRSGTDGSLITVALSTGTGLSSLSGSLVTDTTSGQSVGSCNAAGTTATCSIYGSVAGGDQVSVELDGVTNPSSSGTQTLKVSTSSDTTSATSSGYTITAASASAQPSVTVGSPSSAA